jgi:hypothetical protein
MQVSVKRLELRLNLRQLRYHDTHILGTVSDRRNASDHRYECNDYVECFHLKCSYRTGSRSTGEDSRPRREYIVWIESPFRGAKRLPCRPHLLNPIGLQERYRARSEAGSP